jgi:hypothetical protein
MMLRNRSKSLRLPRETSSMPSALAALLGCVGSQSVHAAGTSERLPFGRTRRTSNSLRRLMLLITARVCPSNGCRLRIIVTWAGTSRRWVV